MARSVQATPLATHSFTFTRLAVGLGTLGVVVLATLTLFEFSNWDKITPGATALGTSIGGMSRAEAQARLAPGVQQLLDRPLDVHGGDQVWHTSARDLGLHLDPNDLVDTAYQLGRHGSPLERFGEQLDTYVHGHTVTTASMTDRTALENSLGNMAHQIERPPTDAHLNVAANGAVQAGGAQDGLSVDIAASRDKVAAALNGDSRSVDLVIASVPPSIPDGQLQIARDQLVSLIAPDAQPFTVTFGDKSWQLERDDLVKLVSVTGGTSPGQPAVVKIDDVPLRAWADRLSKEINQTVQDARFNFNGGNLKVQQPSRQGRTLDEDAMVEAVHTAMLSGQHSVELPVAVVEPSVSSDDPQSLGITELIDRGSTSFAGSVPEKKHNIQLAAQRLNGVVVAPGATFSFNDEVGPTTIDAGFQWGFGIAAGDDGPKTVPSVAGGICQVATTLFQPVFWSGYQLEERYWHLYWIPAYTSRGVVGLDVTVDSDSGVDFQWTNTTKDYILIQADTDDANVYFGLYGKKPNWKVQVDDAVISNRVPPDPKPTAEEEPTMPWGKTVLVETARDGFDAEVVRHVIPPDGGKPRDLDLKSTYQPARTVTLVGSAGKPAGASINDAIQHVLDAQKPAEPKPTASAAVAAPPVATASAAASQTAATPAATAQAVVPLNQPTGPTNQPAPTKVPAAKPPATAVPAAKPAAPTATPATRAQAPTPKPTPGH
jgi:vancomycin resistance protein YoaR